MAVPARPVPRDALYRAVRAERFPDWHDVLNESAAAQQAAQDAAEQAARTAVEQARGEWHDTDLDRARRRRVLRDLPDAPGRHESRRRPA